MGYGSTIRLLQLPCSVAPVATGRSAVCRSGLCTTLRRAWARASWRAFLVNRLLLLRKQRGGTGEILPRNKKGGSEGLPSEVSGMTRIFHDDGNGRHIRHKQKKL